MDARFQHHKASVDDGLKYHVGVCSCGWRCRTVRGDSDSALKDAIEHLHWCARLASKGNRKSKRRGGGPDAA